jgi:hypothetical protein
MPGDAGARCDPGPVRACDMGKNPVERRHAAGPASADAGRPKAFSALAPSRASPSKAPMTQSAKSSPLKRLVWKKCMSLVSEP